MPLLGDRAFTAEATHVSGRRFVAHLLDGIVFTFTFAVLSVPFAVTSDVALVVYLVLAATIGHVAYFVLTQRHSGRTPGKRVLGIRVVDSHGRTPSVGALVRRSIPLLFEYFYVIAFISMQTSEYRQRLGDRWGETFVIRGSSGSAVDPPTGPDLASEEIRARAAAERAARDAMRQQGQPPANHDG